MPSHDAPSPPICGRIMVCPFGIQTRREWQPMPALELTALYTILDRTNVIDLPYEQFEGELLRFQLQWNY